MVMTILEARVARERWTALEQAFQEAAQEPEHEPGLVQSFLIHSLKDEELWRILTVWASQAALQAMRNLGGTPRGVLIFRSAQAEPALSIFDIPQQIPVE